jgi:transformation/transcription domain-associated protein
MSRRRRRRAAARSAPALRGGKERPGAEAAREKAAAEKAARDAEDEEEKDGEAKDGESKETKDGDTKASDAPSSTASPASPFPEPNRPGSLSVKETVLFLSKLAHLTRLGREVTQTTEWEEKLLGTLHALCAFEGHKSSSAAPADPAQPTLRQEVFQKVERNHLLGLRTRHPELRKKFFALYHGAVGQSLFHRLQFVLAGQEWDAMADTFWLKQGLDLILSTLAEDERVTLAPNSARVPSLLPERGARGGETPDAEKRALAAASDPKSGGPPPPPPPPRPVGRDAPKRPNEKTKAMLDRHAAFVHRVASLRVANLVGPSARGGDAQRARRVLPVGPGVPYRLGDAQARGADAAGEAHDRAPVQGVPPAASRRAAQRRAGAARGYLALAAAAQDPVRAHQVPRQNLQRVAHRHRALENHVVRYPQEARCFDALAELYRLLGEQDVLVGLWRQRCNSEVTRVGLALTQHGHWQEAQDVFFRGMQRASAGQVTGVTKTELCLWETNWLESAKQLNQWELVSDFRAFGGPHRFAVTLVLAPERLERRQGSVADVREHVRGGGDARAVRDSRLRGAQQRARRRSRAVLETSGEAALRPLVEAARAGRRRARAQPA